MSGYGCPARRHRSSAGRIARDGDRLIFNYGQSYLDRNGRIPIYEPELPLRSGAIAPEAGLSMAGCLRDAAPDCLGPSRHPEPDLRTQGQGCRHRCARRTDLSAGIRFRPHRRSGFPALPPSEYVPRDARAATLEELLNAAGKVENGEPLTPDLDQALFHGTSLGGARPEGDDPGWRHEGDCQVLVFERHLQRGEGGVCRHAPCCQGGARRGARAS